MENAPPSEPEELYQSLVFLGDKKRAPSGSNGDSKEAHESESPQSLEPLKIENVRKQGYLWEELLFSRQKTLGQQGAKEILEKFRAFDVRELPNLYNFPVLWDRFMQLAKEDTSCCDLLVGYVQEAYERLNRSPPKDYNFFCSLMASVLPQGLERSQAICKKLDFLQPTKSQLGQLVVDVANDSRGRTFRELCRQIPSFTNMYACIVPQLYAKYGFENAYSWHIFLVGSGHSPADSYSGWLKQKHLSSSPRVKPFRARKDALYARLDATHEQEATGDEDMSKPWALLELLERQIRFKNISEKTLSDETCARFFATKFFTVEAVIGGLQLINVESVGPLSVRTIIGRVCENGICNTSAAKGHLTGLKEAGISIGSSAFCRLVESLIQEDQSKTLHDVVTCDLHSEIFEDRNLQEGLLAQYIASNDTAQANRTLAVLSIGTAKGTRPTLIRNLLLRTIIRRRDEVAMYRTLEEMINAHIPVTHRTRQYMVQTLVCIDSYPHISVTFLVKVIDIHKRLAVSGSVIDPFEWLGLLRQCREVHTADAFRKYVELLEWLALHYPDGEMRNHSDSHRFYVHGRPKRTIKGPEFWAILFPTKEMFDFLRWSMAVAASDPGSYELLKGHTVEERVLNLTMHPILQGIRFLKRLKTLGVPFNEAKASRSCESRLKFMYNHYGSARRSQRLAKRFRMLAGLEEYILAVESIWEKNIFGRTVSATEYSETMLPSDERRTSFEERDISYFRPPAEGATATTATDASAAEGEGSSPMAPGYNGAKLDSDGLGEHEKLLEEEVDGGDCADSAWVEYANLYDGVNTAYVRQEIAKREILLQDTRRPYREGLEST